MHKQAFNCSLAWNAAAAAVKSHMLLITFPDCTNPTNTCVSYFPYLNRSDCSASSGLGPSRREAEDILKLLVLCVGEPSCWPPASTPASDRQATGGSGARAARSVGDGVRTCHRRAWKLLLFFFFFTFFFSTSCFFFPPTAFLPE